VSDLVIKIKCEPDGYRAHLQGRRGSPTLYKSQFEAIGALLWQYRDWFLDEVDGIAFEICTEKEIERHDRNGCSVRPKGKKWSGKHPVYS
jgi:hypothetical protein